MLLLVHGPHLSSDTPSFAEPLSELPPNRNYCHIYNAAVLHLGFKDGISNYFPETARFYFRVYVYLYIWGVGTLFSADSLKEFLAPQKG